LWLRPHYQFFPVVLVGAGVLAWQRLQGIKHLVPGPHALSYGLVGMAALLLAGAVVIDSSWLGTVSALVLLAGALVGAGGLRLFAAAWPAWAVLWLAVPPPFELDRNLILVLQTFTTRWSSRLLDLFGVFHVMDGHVVEVSGRRLLVEEACAGINSLFSVLACTLLFVLWARRPLVRGALLIVAAAGWVLAANVARVVVIAFLFSTRGVDWTAGWRHKALGLGLFALTLVLVWSTDRLLSFLAGAATRQASGNGSGCVPAVAGPSGRALEGGLQSTWLGSLTVAGVFGALGLANVYLNGVGPDADASLRSQPVADNLARMAEDTMAEHVGGWRRHGFAEATRNPGSAFGEFSKVWIYRRPMQQAVLSLDYPFPGWHDLTRCYTSQGWVIDDESVEQGGPACSGGYVVLRLSKPGQRFGFVVFTEFNGAGKVLAPRMAGARLSFSRHEQAWHRFQGRLTGLPADDSADPPGPVYQLQLFVESYAPLNELQRSQALELFLHSWQRLRHLWTPQEGELRSGQRPSAGATSP
jgi:exosortase